MSIWTFLFGGVDKQFQENVEASTEVDHFWSEYQHTQEKKSNSILEKIEAGIQITPDERTFLIENADCKSIMRVMLTELPR